MNTSQLITIIIPTHNRYKKLLRLLQYYASHKTSPKIRVLDSGNQEQIPRDLQRDLQFIMDHKLIEYTRYPQDIFIAKKISEGVKGISTAYSVLCADDDFIAPVGLEKCVEFLELHPDYTAAQGTQIVFKQDINNPKILDWELISTNTSIELDSPCERIFAHFSDYNTPTFYAVHRTGILQSIWESTNKYTDDLRFGELLSTLLTVTYGKMKVLDILYSARENFSTSDGRTSKKISDFIIEGSFSKKYQRFKKCLAASISECEGLAIESSKEIIDRAMNDYLKKKCGASISRLSFKLKIKKIIYLLGGMEFSNYLKKNLFHPKPKDTIPSKFPYKNPNNPYYQDFMHIKKTVTSGI